MPTYTNPSGTVVGTSGDDAIVFNSVLPGSGSFDALDGNDSLTVQFDASGADRFGVFDESNAGSFTVQLTYDWFTSFYVFRVEHVELHGTSNNDSFWLVVRPSSLGLSVALDGGGGTDDLRYDWSNLATGMSFVVNGSTVTSNFGSFANFETYSLRGGPGNDTIVTGSGVDYIETGGGTDNVDAGAGNDAIDVRSAGGAITGGDGNDRITFEPSTTWSSFAGSIDGGNGTDFLDVSAIQLSHNLDFVVSGTSISSNIGSFANFENFWIRGSGQDDNIRLWSGADTVVAGDGNDTVYAGDGADTVDGEAGSDTLVGDGGNDTIHGGVGDDAVYGGDGNDTLYGDQLEFSIAGDGNDHVDGGAGDDTIYGGGGSDDLIGGDGNDTIRGGLGADHIDGGNGDDWINGFGGDYYNRDDNLRDTLLGGAGNDHITAGYGDTVDGGAGQDWLDLDLSGSPTGVNADLRQLTSGGTMTVGNASLAGIELITGIRGSEFDDVIVAGAVQGIDGINILGGAGNDDLTGSSGVDWIYGGEGNDIIRGGVGFNPAISPGQEHLYGENGDDTFFIGPDGALVYGGNGNDIIHGGSGNDDLAGDAGDDWISGGAGADGLRGGDGNDTFIDTAANFNGDVIDRLDAGDKIIIMDANIANFTFSLSGYTLTYTGGSLRFNSTVQGSLVATGLAGGGVQITLRQPELVTLDTIATQLTNGYWGGSSHHWPVTQGGSLTVDISTLNSTEQTLARAALHEWTDIIGVNFQENIGGAQITFDNSADPSGPVAATDATYANGIITSAHIHISTSWLTAYGSTLDSYGLQTYVHEVGHALGLGHPGTYNGDGAYYSDALFANDSWATSVMSYFDQRENAYFNNQGFTRNYALTPMQADILAAQSLYGLSTNARPGDTVYGYNSNAGGIYDATFDYAAAFTIFDTGGNDTLDYSGTLSNVRLNLNAETFSNVNGLIGNVSIARGVTIENAIGGSGADVLIGNAVANVLTGGAGYDTLTGGAGNDTFRDTIAGLNGDTITDFGAGDRIVFTNATLANLTLHVVGNTVEFNNGASTWTIILSGDSAQHHLIAQAAPGGGVQLLVHDDPARNDFNGDGRSDLLLRDGSGTVFTFLGGPNGGYANNGGNSAVTMAAAWQVAGTGDFNHDGRVDILWRNDNGAIFNFLGTASGGFANNGDASFVSVATSAKVVGIGDFNGDGRSDILWRDASGTIFNFLGTSNGGYTNNGGNSAVTVGAAWHVAGIGDFNGDGVDDILWRNDHGAIFDFLGTAIGGFTSNGDNSYVAGAATTQVAGIGDFNGDGRSDILWRDASGTIFDFLGTASGGYTNNGGNSAVNVSGAWHVASIGDFNGDGIDDVLWRNDNGNIFNFIGTNIGGFVNNGDASFVALGTSTVPQDPFL